MVCRAALRTATVVAMAVLHPPQRSNPDGAPRKVAVEIAFVGLDLGDAASHVCAQFGGEVRKLSSARTEVADTKHGTFVLRRDAPAGPSAGAGGNPGGHSRTRRQTRETGARVAGFVTGGRDIVTPTEISCPPLPYERLDDVEELLDLLRRRGSADPPDVVSYPIGFELEPEAPSLEPERVCAILRAYLLMCDWLRKDVSTDNLSDVLPVPSAFPLEYRRKVADPAYLPDEDAFLADYVAANPTRDRELDLYPLLVHVHGPRPEIRKALGEDGPPRPRPAFRYRLPRAAVERGGGRVTDEWNRWVQVERLAEDPERLARMGRAFLEHEGDFFGGDWADESGRWLA